MGAFFNFIFTVLLIVVGFRVFFFYLLPWFLKRKIQKMQDGFGQQVNKTENRKEGEVHFDKTSKNVETVGKDDVGEYVDFEEVD